MGVNGDDDYHHCDEYHHGDDGDEYHVGDDGDGDDENRAAGLSGLSVEDPLQQVLCEQLLLLGVPTLDETCCIGIFLYLYLCLCLITYF